MCGACGSPFAGCECWKDRMTPQEREAAQDAIVRKWWLKRGEAPPGPIVTLPEKRSWPRMGHWATPETRALLSETQKARWQGMTPAERQARRRGPAA